MSIETNIIDRNNKFYYLTQQEVTRELIKLDLEVAEWVGRCEENDRQFREALYGQSKPVGNNTPKAESRV